MIRQDADLSISCYTVPYNQERDLPSARTPCRIQVTHVGAAYGAVHCCHSGRFFICDNDHEGQCIMYDLCCELYQSGAGEV
jgi:hypothetical protein